MKKLLLYLLIAVPVFLGVRCSCDDNPVASSGETGSVNARLFVDRVGSLAKVAKVSAIELSKAYLEISTDGETTLKDSFDLSGSGSQTVGRIFADIKVRAWEAKAWVVDLNGEVTHLDSTTFTVVENDTIDANLVLTAKYSMLVAKFYPISDSAKSAEVWVNGTLVADSVFGKNASFDTLRLYFDYLAAAPDPGIAATILLNVRGDWIDPDTLLWTGQGVVNVVSGQDISQTIPLDWVGPQVGGVNMTVEIGRVGTVFVDAVVRPRPNT